MGFNYQGEEWAPFGQEMNKRPEGSTDPWEPVAIEDTPPEVIDHYNALYARKRYHNGAPGLGANQPSATGEVYPKRLPAE